jgi:hypothetical protein
MKLTKATKILPHGSSIVTTMMLLTMLAFQVSFQGVQGQISCSGGVGTGVCDTTANTFTCDATDD